MLDKFNGNLFNFVLTQKSVYSEMPYDLIERIIQESILNLKKENINARIVNLALNINGKLVLAQLYIERKNGFAPTQNPQFGTSPTCYNVQLRFPFGLETVLGKNTVLLPSGDFLNPLSPYLNSNREVSDDVRRDFHPSEIVCGPGVISQIDNNKNTLSLATVEKPTEAVNFSYSLNRGKGFVSVAGEKYQNIQDYNACLKTTGVYPLFYSNKKNVLGLLRYHDDYPGYTHYQGGRGEFEPNNNENKRRLDEYNHFISEVNQQITQTRTGQYWLDNRKKIQQSASYVFDITIVNGVALFTLSGLPVVRLRDYQLELFHHCLPFIEAIDQQSQTAQRRDFAGKISMGVGAGKTFFTLTLLQYIKDAMQSRRLKLAPPFCLAPDEGVAEVTQRSIDRQGVTVGTSASTITKQAQMPNAQFMKLYQALTARAVADAKIIDDYIQEGLQTDILNFCREKNLHPNKMVNLFYVDQNYKSQFETFKNSIDVKRLLLMVDAQKTIISKAGMLTITALKNLSEQFNTLEESAKKIFAKKKPDPVDFDVVNINYNQSVDLPNTLRTTENGGKINIAALTEKQLRDILYLRYNRNTRAIRDALIRVACFGNNEAAVLFANSGGLGNTYTEQELSEQVTRCLPVARRELVTLATKRSITHYDHYTLYLYLKEILVSPPDEINFKFLFRKKNPNKDALFDAYLLGESLRDNLDLITYIKDKISKKIKAISKVSQIGRVDSSTLTQFGILHDTNVIEASNQLAGIASLQVTGSASGDASKLLLTHIPVFTPEGFACYFEHLASLEGQFQTSFKQENGIYLAKPLTQRVSKKDIQDRLWQILNAVMIADEVHKEEFKFLYETTNPVYQRINIITNKYLGKKFIDVLPHRIGMSGTINNVSEQAFSKTTLYSLSTQTMMQQGLMKQVSIDSQSMLSITEDKVKTEDELKKSYAKQIVVDYFLQNSNFSVKNLFTTDANCFIELFKVSKGLIFSKIPDQALNQYIMYFFNLLAESSLKNDEKSTQLELFNAINEGRKNRAAILQQKINGQLELTPTERQQIGFYNAASEKKITVTGNKISGVYKQINLTDLNVLELAGNHLSAFQSNLFTLYFEYLLSKTNSPKEFSDIVGLQNKLYEKGRYFIDLDLNRDAENEREIANFLPLIQAIDPSTITEESVKHFIQERIKDKFVSDLLIDGILTYKNNYQQVSGHIKLKMGALSLNQLITLDRDEFESGKTFVMIGGEKERTGYSHEPVGIVVDAPSNLHNMRRIDQFIDKLDQKALQEKDIPEFFGCLQTLARESFSYDEKNQAGGRALRTPYGYVRYIQYQTKLNEFIEKSVQHFSLLALKLETQFQDIFTSDEKLAQEQRASITFNRETILLLEQNFSDIRAFSLAICKRFSKELKDKNSKQQYENYIYSRLPLLWSMKYQPAIATQYFGTFDEGIFEKLEKPTILEIDDSIGLSPEIISSSATTTTATTSNTTTTATTSMTKDLKIPNNMGLDSESLTQLTNNLNALKLALSDAETNNLADITEIQAAAKATQDLIDNTLPLLNQMKTDSTCQGRIKNAIDAYRATLLKFSPKESWVKAGTVFLGTLVGLVIAVIMATLVILAITNPAGLAIMFGAIGAFLAGSSPGIVAVVSTGVLVSAAVGGFAGFKSADALATWGIFRFDPNQTRVKASDFVNVLEEKLAEKEHEVKKTNHLFSTMDISA